MGRKKYELTEETKIVSGHKLFRIKALVDFGDVKAGEIGGYIEREENLRHEGNAWVSDEACVYGHASVFENACVYGHACVYGDACVCGDARVYGDACVCGDARVCGDACVSEDADYLCFKGLGHKNRNTTFFKCKDGRIYVSCGCFSGTLLEFEEEVKETHGDSRYAKEYLACADVVKIHFNVPEQPKPLNTKIVITESSDNSNFTVGKIYKVKDGYFISDCGEQYPSEEPIKDIDDLEEYFKGDEESTGKRNGYFSDETIKFVEIVEE